MRFAIAPLLVAPLFSLGIGHADPFATRRAPADRPAAPAAVESVVVQKPCDCEQTPFRLSTARVLGATAVGLGLSTLILGWYEKGRYHDAVDRMDYRTADDAQLTLRYVGTGLALASMATAGVSLYLYLTAPESEPPRTIVAPIASADQLGLGVAHSF